MNGFSGNTTSFFKFCYYNRNVLNAVYLKQLGFTGGDLNKILSLSPDQAGYIRDDESKSLKSFNELYLWRNFNSDIMQSAAQIGIFKTAQFAKMYNLNVTFPYTDKEIFEFLRQMPLEMKYRGTIFNTALGSGKSKYLFKQYLINKLPIEIKKRRKQGSYAPLAIFLEDKNTREKIYSFVIHTLSDSGLFNSSELEQVTLKVEKAASDQDLWFWYKQTRFNQLFNLLTLSLWWKQYMCDDMRQSLSDYFN
jgi:hypothetical protein